MVNKIYLIVFLLIALTQAKSQTNSNLEKIYLLIDRSVEYADSIACLESNLNSINLSLPNHFDVLKPRIINSFINKGYKVISRDSVDNKLMIYSLLNVGTEYSDIFKDGFFGDYFVTRKLSLTGSVLIQAEKFFYKPNQFYFMVTDTVRVEETENLENKFIPFTRGVLPDPMLLNNLLEPILVVGTLIVTIILFFTIRGK